MGTVSMAKFKVVVTVINEDSVMPCPIGPRFRHQLPMPMEKLYQERKGYWFDPETELELARECADQFTGYLARATAKKRKNNR